jgi:hypothetical protein
MAAVIESFVGSRRGGGDLHARPERRTLRNWNGIEVGSLRATSALRLGLGAASARASA